MSEIKNNNITKEDRLKAQRDYMAKWRAKNKDKIKGYRDKYWDKKASESIENQEK